VNGPPAPGVAVRGEPFAEDARYRNQQDEIRRDRTETDVESPEWRQEGNERINDVHPLGQDLGHDVDDEKYQRAEGDRPVDGLSHHPVSWLHHDTVSGEQADHYRGGQAEKREYPGVEKHETLRSSIDVTAGGGHDQDEYDNDGDGDHGCHDRPRVVPSPPPRSRMHTLTTA
jgi:hypothetical protein